MAETINTLAEVLGLRIDKPAIESVLVSVEGVSDATVREHHLDGGCISLIAYISLNSTKVSQLASAGQCKEYVSAMQALIEKSFSECVLPNIYVLLYKEQTSCRFEDEKILLIHKSDAMYWQEGFRSCSIDKTVGPVLQQEHRQGNSLKKEYGSYQQACSVDMRLGIQHLAYSYSENSFLVAECLFAAWALLYFNQSEFAIDISYSRISNVESRCDIKLSGEWISDSFVAQYCKKDDIYFNDLLKQTLAFLQRAYIQKNTDSCGYNFVKLAFHYVNDCEHFCQSNDLGLLLDICDKSEVKPGLTLCFCQSDSSVLINWIYDTALYSESDVIAHCKSFEELVLSVSENPRKKLREYVLEASLGDINIKILHEEEASNSDNKQQLHDPAL